MSALVLPAGDVPVAVAGRDAPRLEVEPGIVRVIAAGRTTAHDVRGCRLAPVEDGTAQRQVAFVRPDGEVRCRVDLLEWVPGLLAGDPGTPGTAADRWLDRVTAAVAAAAGTPRDERAVPATGPELHAVPRRRVLGRTVAQLVAVLGAVICSYVGNWTGSAAVFAVGGVSAVLLAVLAAVPRAWWPRRPVPARVRVALAHPRGTGRAELALTDDGLLVHTTADGLRRWLPAAGPTAPVGAAVPPTGPAVVELPGAVLDVTPRTEADRAALTELLRAAGLTVSRSPAPVAPDLEPALPSGTVGDARWNAGVVLGLLALGVSVYVAAHDSGAVAVLAYPLAAVIGLAGGLRAAVTHLQLRRAVR